VTAAGRPQRDGLSIGAVLAQLRGDFPDVTISKIRFLESEGLVQPARTPSGYRQFTATDVERLRFILAAQRDHYLPLKVIKEQLDAADRGIRSAPGKPRLPRRLVPLGAPEGDDGMAPVLGPGDATDAEVRLGSEELLGEAGIDEVMLAELRQYGLIRASSAGYYSADDVQIARTVKKLTEFGVEPRHLRGFRASADREVGLVEQIVAPVSRQRGPDAQGRAAELAREFAGLSLRLHMLLVKAGIREVTGG
jgi:DNA-binding transcriptional MerR regulator